MIKNNIQEGLSDYKKYQKNRMSHWNKVVSITNKYKGCSGYYPKRLNEVLQFVVPPVQKVTELGCGTDDLLVALKPSYGGGVDFSPKMIARARDRCPHLHFIEGDAHELELKIDHLPYAEKNR
jgi:ubiquinone/menaquinone biosynthesis C-methylase UbiE